MVRAWTYVKGGREPKPATREVALRDWVQGHDKDSEPQESIKAVRTTVASWPDLAPGPLPARDPPGGGGRDPPGGFLGALVEALKKGKVRL